MPQNPPGRARGWKPVMLSLAVGLAGCSLLSQPADSTPPVPVAAVIDQETDVINANLIRVGISDDAMTSLEYPETRITANGPFEVLDMATSRSIWQGQPGQIATIRVNKSHFTVQTPGGSFQPVGPLKLQPLADKHWLKITNITRRGEQPSFRGVFEVHRGFSSPAKLSVINIVSLEDYLKAVVPNELPMRYGNEAVKAQSVAARNYAIRPREKPWPNFDICDSQYCQVYLGAQTETPGSNQTIAATDGLVALYEGEPVLALFSSSHGGYAENYAYAFSDPKTKQYPAPEIPYLKGGPDVPMNLDLTQENAARAFWTNPNAASFDVKSPYYRWRKQWSRAEAETAINKGLLEVSKDSSTRDFVSPQLKPGQSIGTLKRINVLRRGTSGKVMVMEIQGSNGVWTVQKEFLLRKVLTHGGRMLPSGNVVFSHLTGGQGQLVSLVAEGGGFGHGVGMSQLGASYMSEVQGKKFPEIIQHYYRGAAIGSIPITVGNGADRPVLVSFKPTQARGTLWVETDTKTPVRLRLNDQLLTVTPTGKRTSITVNQHIKANEVNQLVLFPDAQQPTRIVKAWVELIPPKS